MGKVGGGRGARAAYARGGLSAERFSPCATLEIAGATTASGQSCHETFLPIAPNKDSDSEPDKYLEGCLAFGRHTNH